MKLEIMKVEATNQSKKVLYVEEGLTEYVYDGKHLMKYNNKTNKRYDYYKHPQHSVQKPFPKAMNKLVIEMDFILDSLVENDHIRAEVK